MLSPDELQRAARFHAAEHGNRFIVAHARLRQQLAGLLSVAPADIRFAVGPHGKPAIAGELSRAGLEFNLSHSGSLALIGWSWQRAIGVDIEVWRPMHDEAALVRRFFSSAEIAAYEDVPAAERTRAFFNCWTRKEAYVKAVGRGLALPLDSFAVSVGDAAEARLLHASALQNDDRRWHLGAPSLAGDLSLAVVLEGDPFRVIES